MRRSATIAAALGIAVAGAAGGAVAATALHEDEIEVVPVTVQAAAASTTSGAGSGTQAPSIVAEDGIAPDHARALAAAATEEVPGQAVSVEADDGLFQVEVRDERGALVEVLIDDDERVVGIDRGDD